MKEIVDVIYPRRGKPIPVKIRPIPDRGKRYAPNGARECARRMHQIYLGQLKADNGARIAGNWPHVETDRKEWEEWAGE